MGGGWPLRAAKDTTIQGGPEEAEARHPQEDSSSPKKTRPARLLAARVMDGSWMPHDASSIAGTEPAGTKSLLNNER